MRNLLILIGTGVAYFIISPRAKRKAMIDKLAVLGDPSGDEKTPREVKDMANAVMAENW